MSLFTSYDAYLYSKAHKMLDKDIFLRLLNDLSAVDIGLLETPLAYSQLRVDLLNTEVPRVYLLSGMLVRVISCVTLTDSTDRLALDLISATPQVVVGKRTL